MRFLIKEHRNGKYFVYELYSFFGINLGWRLVNRLANAPMHRGGFFSTTQAEEFARDYKKQEENRKNRVKKKDTFVPRQYEITI